MKHLVILLVVMLSHAAQAQQTEFKSFSDITQSLNPLETIANHGGVKRSIDLNIQFALGSDHILEAAANQLGVLAEAMQSPRLSEYDFMLIGHTDAQGTADYNQGLSQQRAESVKAYLLQHAALTGRLQAQGKGETQLLAKLAPNDARHRRVEVIAIPRDNTAANQEQAQSQQAAPTKPEPTQNEDGSLNIAW